MFNREQVVRRHDQRRFFLLGIVFFLFFLIVLRLVYLQIIKGQEFHQYALKNSLRKEIIFAPRGEIFSTDGSLLVSNKARYDLMITPQYLEDKKETFHKLEKIIGVTLKEIESKLKAAGGQAKYIPIQIKKSLTMQEIAIVETELSNLPGVTIQEFIARQYMMNEVGAHLLGYVNQLNADQVDRYTKIHPLVELHPNDLVGNGGVELTWDAKLRGQNGYEFIEVDARGRKKPRIHTHNLFEGIKDRIPVSGNNIKLTIDLDLQQIADDGIGTQVGSVVVMDVRNGEILVMTSKPSFSPAVFSEKLTSKYWNSLLFDPRKPLIDRNVQQHYSPGSTLKPFTAITLLEEGKITEKTRINCSGSFPFGRKVYHCWKKQGHGAIDIVGAIRESCNIFFWQNLARLSIDTLHRYYSMFGFGEKTGINLPQEVPGLNPSTKWKLDRLKQSWQQGETLSVGIGQSFFLASTLQLARAYAAIANEGKVFKPHLVKEITDQNGKSVYRDTPELVREIKLKPNTWKYVKMGLHDVVMDPRGSGQRSRPLKTSMAGKTGTSQVRSFSANKIYDLCELNPYESRHHGLFVGYAPADNPKIAMAIIIEHACHGSTAAAPIASKIADKYFEKYLQKNEPPHVDVKNN